METTRNTLTPEQKRILDGLSDYLDTKLFYYGSIQRPDYVSGKSDIDVDIFTDNESSVISKLLHYLHLDKNKVKKVLWKVRNHSKLVNGYKIKYKSDYLNAEFSIYSDQYKKYVLEEHNSKVDFPFYFTWILNILKFLYYELNILPKETFSYLKNKTINFAVGLTNDDIFITYK
jgi:hypothetical protein